MYWPAGHQHHLHINKNQMILLLWSYKCWFFCVKPVQLCKLNLFFYIGPHFFLFSTSHIYQHMVFVSKIALYFGHIPPFKKKRVKNITRGGTNGKKNPFWCVLLQSTVCPPRPPSHPANECPDVGGVWAEPRARRGSGSVAASLQQEDRLLGFVWWMWMSSITSFRDVDGYLDVATFPLSHPEAPSRHR